MPHMGFLGIEFWKTIVTFEKKTPSISLNWEILWTNKNSLRGYFGVRTWKNYCHIKNQHARSFLIVKFHEKMKFPKFGTKNSLFGCFFG